MCETVDFVKRKFEEICRKLNMDRETEDASWNKYTEVSKRYTLEGKKIHWLCCALYSASRGSHTPTVGGQNPVNGNCVSFNMLLRCCDMSISEFFQMMRKWYDMANLSRSFAAQVDRMEKVFAVTFHLFQRYNFIFDKLFLCPRIEKSNNKYRDAKCSYNKLKELCWCLYLCAKNENPSYAEEIIHSLHLLICCIDFVYVNVLHEKRSDLIKPDFAGIPKNWNTIDFTSKELENFCIIGPLCDLTSGQIKDALSIKQDLWKKIITDFFRNKTLIGNEHTYLEVISSQNFERNLKSLKTSYEQFILSAGEFDERVLFRREPTDTPDGGRISHQAIRSLNPISPFLRRDILPSKETSTEPVANATANVRKLQEIAYITEPTEYIRKMDPQVLDKIMGTLSQMAEKFNESYPNKAESVNRFQLAKSLFFYLLEKIILVEYATKPNINLKVLFNTDTFTTSLIVCCVEIVLNAYSSHLIFPWVLKECFNIYPFHFCRIIEIVVRRHDNILTRSLIKHLNFIEETCLESLIWASNSIIWEILQESSESLPTWAEVDVSNRTRRPTKHDTHSPSNSAYDTFNPTSPQKSARRDLFNVCEKEEKLQDQRRNFEINKRAGSLSIFLRKFYKLAWMRMEKLCELLGSDLEKNDKVNVIWTLFEHAITHKTELLKDRHLDQILMCAIYIYLKVSETEGILFSDILVRYRMQPQAKSEIYRNVPLANKEEGDIIRFYNTLFVEAMSDYARQFCQKDQENKKLLLSPHPVQNQMYSKIIDPNNTRLTICQMPKSDLLMSPNQISISIDKKNLSKELNDLNETVRRGKRSLPLDDESYKIDKKHFSMDMIENN